MSQPPYNDLISIFRAAAQSLLGGTFLWMVTCTMAGAVPVLAVTESFETIDWPLVFAWVGHLIGAAMALWGVVVLCVHALCLAALVHGTHSVRRVLLVAFAVQLTTSTIVTIAFDSDGWWRALAAWAVLVALCVIGWCLSLRKKRVDPSHEGIERLKRIV